MIDKLKSLILYLNAAIDSGKNDSITITDISVEISTENIFNFIQNKIQSTMNFDSKMFSKEEREHLMIHWQVLLNTGDLINQVGVQSSGLCLLLAYAVMAIQSSS